MGNKLRNKKKQQIILKKISNSREEVINFFRDYAKMMLDAGCKAKQDITEQRAAGLKILTPKQMLQRLPITLAQIKADNTSENIRNEVRQVIYSLYRAK